MLSASKGQGLGCGYAPQHAGMTSCGGIHHLHGWAPPPQDLAHLYVQAGDKHEQNHEQVMHRAGRVSQLLFRLNSFKKMGGQIQEAL